MADISKVRMLNGTEYNYKDAKARSDIEGLKADLDAKAVSIDADISDLQEKTLDFTESSSTNFLEVSGDDSYFINPDTDAVVYYGGKNFILLEDMEESTINGVTYSVEDGAISLNGTATAGTFLPLNASPIPISTTGQANIKVWKDGGTASANFSIRLYSGRSATGTLYINGSIYKDFSTRGTSDVEIEITNAPNGNGYLFVFAPSGITFENLVIRPMLTLGNRYTVFNYGYGEIPIAITEKTAVRGRDYCCIQSHDGFTIINTTSKTDNLTDVVYGGNTKSVSGKIIKITDGLPCSKVASITATGNSVKVIGKNLINYHGWFESVTGNPLKYQPIALKPNMNYVYTDAVVDATHMGGYVQVRYGGNTDGTSSVCATIVGASQTRETCFTTPDYDGQYYLRYYGNICAEMRGGEHGDFTHMMLVEGDSVLEDFEEYTETEYSIDSARLTGNSVSYIYTDDLENITVTYHESDNSKSMPYYWQDYMDAKKMDLRKKVLSASMHGLIFSFITDVHIDENTCNSSYLLDYLREEVGIPLTIFGGDLLNYANNEEPEAITQFYRFKKLYVKDSNTLCTPGNHDFYSPLAEGSFYNLFIKPIELMYNTNATNSVKRTYFYIDNASQKARLIFLDSNDWNVEKPAMFEWFVEVLNSIPSGWECVIFSHILERGTYYGNDIPYLASEYNSRNSGSRTLGDNSGTIAYDFTNGAGHVFCAIGGHSHKDYYNDSFGIPVILTTTDCIGNGTVQHAAAISMTKGTATENAFDVFFIDFDAQTIDAVRIGAGEDRHWDFSE